MTVVRDIGQLSERHVHSLEQIVGKMCLAKRVGDATRQQPQRGRAER